MKNVDLVKILMYVLLFLLTVFAIIFFVLIPSVREYKQSKKTFAMEKRDYITTRDALNEEKTHLNNVNHENKKIIDAFARQYQKEELLAFLQQFFETVSVEEVEPDALDDSVPKEHAASGELFETKEFTVAVYMSTPVKFQEFMQALNDYKQIVKVEFPIKFEKEGVNLSSLFRLKIIQLQYN
jgi:uncharacterized protein YpmS